MRVSTAIQLLRDTWSGVLDLVYPPFCLVCKEPDQSYLCPKCIEQIITLERPFCNKCGIPCDPTHYYCPECQQREFHFDSACSAGVFDGVLRDAIHALKFSNHIVMAQPLGELMARCFTETRLAGKVDVAVPIPIHRSRLLERGFNQSEELARVLCERVSLPLETRAIVKTKKTKDQVDLPEDRRFANLEGSFFVTSPNAIAGKRVLLIDDVMTTGATLNEAAKTLREAGASAVFGYTLSRKL